MSSKMGAEMDSPFSLRLREMRQQVKTLLQSAEEKAMRKPAASALRSENEDKDNASAADLRLSSRGTLSASQPRSVAAEAEEWGITSSTRSATTRDTNTFTSSQSKLALTREYMPRVGQAKHLSASNEPTIMNGIQQDSALSTSNLHRQKERASTSALGAAEATRSNLYEDEPRDSVRSSVTEEFTVVRSSISQQLLSSPLRLKERDGTNDYRRAREAVRDTAVWKPERHTATNSFAASHGATMDLSTAMKELVRMRREVSDRDVENIHLRHKVYVSAHELAKVKEDLNSAKQNLERERDERAILQEQYSVLKEDLKKALNEADRSGMRTAMDEVAFLKQALREAQEQWSIEAETRKELESQLARQPNHSISEIKEVGVATSPANLSNGRRSPVSPSSSASEEVVEGLKRTVGELEEELKRAREDSDDREEIVRVLRQLHDETAAELEESQKKVAQLIREKQTVERSQAEQLQKKPFFVRELDDEYGKQEMSSSTDSLQRENELLQRRLEESERRYREQTAQIRDLEDFQRDIVEENKHLEAALKQDRSSAWLEKVKTAEARRFEVEKKAAVAVENLVFCEEDVRSIASAIDAILAGERDATLDILLGNSLDQSSRKKESLIRAISKEKGSGAVDECAEEFRALLRAARQRLAEACAEGIGNECAIQ